MWAGIQEDSDWKELTEKAQDQQWMEETEW